MNTSDPSSKVDKLISNVTAPMSDFMQVFSHVTSLFLLQLINIYADNISTRDDVRAIMTGMIAMGAFLILRSLWSALRGHTRLNFSEFIFPVAIFMATGFFIATCGADIIDAVLANPKCSALYVIGFALGTLFLRFRSSQMGSVSSYECNSGLGLSSNFSKTKDRIES
jgi:hypothetical protein